MSTGLKSLTLACLCCCLLNETAIADDSSTYGQAVQAWRHGDTDTAAQLLGHLADSGSDDPLVWYYKGVLAEQSGADGSADFERAAALETRAFTLRHINRELEPIQGELRLKIERIRRQAHITARPHDQLAAQMDLYRQGLNALGKGDREAAEEAFSQAIQAGTEDPRPYFMRAILRKQNGDSEAAADDVRQGIVRETTTRQIEAVDRALERVQGRLRVWLEKEVSIGSAENALTRSHHRLQIMAAERERYEQMLAANQEDRQKLLDQQAIEDRQQMEAAAARIAAGQAADEKVADLLSSPVTSTAPTAGNAPATGTTPATTNTGVPQPQTSASTATSPAAASGINTSWLAPNNEVVLYIRVADLVNSQFFKPLLDMPQAQQGLNDMAAEVGFAPTDIESITIGLGDVGSLMLQAGAQVQAGPGNPNAMMNQVLNNGNALVVVRTSTPLDYAQLAASISAQETSFNGTTYYQIPPDNNQQGPSAAYVVDPQTYIFGGEQSVQAAIQRGPGAASNPQLSFVPASSGFAIAVASPTLAGLTQMIPNDPNASQSTQDLTAALRGNLSAVAITLDATQDLTLKLRMILQDQAAGTKAAEALTASIAESKQMFGAFKPMIPAQLQPIAQTAIDSTTTSYQAPVVSWSLTIPGELVTTLKDSPEILMPLMMGAGAMGGPGGGLTPPAEFPQQPPPPR